MKEFRKRLQDDVVIMDGGMATALRRKGLPEEVPPEFWNLDHPDHVTAVHREYVEAGSEIILTNTFQASGVRLQAWGAGDKADEINRRAVKLARSAAGEKVLVAGDIGPAGTAARESDVAKAFFEQADILAAAGCDLLVLETFSTLAEMRVAFTAVRKAAPGLPVIALMTFSKTGRTTDGLSPDTVARVFVDLGADVIGANCSWGPGPMVAVMETMARVVKTPLCAKPSAGVPRPLSADAWARYGEVFLKTGVTFLGGCCGTTPEYIHVLDMRVRDLLTSANKEEVKSASYIKQRELSPDRG